MHEQVRIRDAYRLKRCHSGSQLTSPIFRPHPGRLGSWAQSLVTSYSMLMEWTRWERCEWRKKIG